MNKLHIVNTIMIASGMVALLKVLYISDWLIRVNILIPLVVAMVAFFIKSYMRRADPSLWDPLVEAKLPRMVFMIGMGVLMIAILFKVMRWPGAFYLFLIDVAIQLAALVLSYTAIPKELKEKREDILDD